MLTQKQLIERFGKPSVDNLTFERKWMEVWIVPVEIREQIPVLPEKIYTHKLMVDKLLKVFTALIDANLHNEIKTWNGCFNIRKKRGLKTLSLHAWGLAIDLNAATNPLGGVVTWSEEFLAVWRRNGWICGADWTRKDGMHFQLL